MKKLSDEERLFTAEHAEIFIKSAVPGAVIHLTNLLSTDAGFESDRLQSDDIYGHNIIIAAIYDNGFVAFETISSSSQERFYTWEEFYDTWSGLENSAANHYTFFQYIKWPSAPILNLGGKGETIQEWSRFLFLLLIGALLFVAGGVLLRFVIRYIPIPKKEDRPGEKALVTFIGLFPILAGGFFTWSSGIAILYLALLLFYIVLRKRKLVINCNEPLILAGMILIAYAVTCLWAVDRGQSPFGIVKFLPMFLFVLVLQQFPKGSRKHLLSTIPWSAAGMLLLSGMLCMLPACRSMFIIDGRFAGFFQYPNAWALYLLAALIIVSYMPKQRFSVIKPFLAVILCAGIILSGSRTVFVLTAVAVVLRAAAFVNNKQRAGLLSGLGVAIAVVLVAAWILPDTMVGRYLRISLSSSTLLGRLLYYQDALPVILRHPFGLGYLGYYYSQGSFQHGVYSAMYVHNELLQLFLDIGWIPALVAAVVLLRQLLNRKLGSEQRLLLFVILAHSMLDFDLQFLAVWFLLLTAMEPGCSLLKKEFTNKIGLYGIPVPICMFVCAVGTALGTASFLEEYLSPELTLAYYPNDVPALMQQLTSTRELDQMNSVADRIIALDSYVSIAHSAKAHMSFSYGNIEKMIQEKQLAIDHAKYAEEEYQDYFDKLTITISLYHRQGDTEGEQYCIERLKDIPQQMQAVLEQTNPLAWRISDTPQLTLTNEQLSYLDSLE
ncbi:MAG: O-antigen ligase family protein [Eubacteriales bacterium]|nr:O-antigen ligase family protein [Eubacteriales bacterium]